MIKAALNKETGKSLIVIELGEGDICINATINEVDKTTGVGFTPLPQKKQVGEDLDEYKGQTVGEMGTQILIQASSPESLDVLIEMLQKSRDLFKRFE